jgi:hypothetical protein
MRLKSESTREIEEIKIQSAREIEQMKIKLLQEAELSKIQLNIKLTEEIEQLKSKLSILMKEHEIKFSGLHRERADVIKNLRSKIISAYYASMGFSNEIGSVLDSKLPFIQEKEGKFSDSELVKLLKEPFDKVWNKTSEASEYSLNSRIYFSRDLYKKIDNFIQMLNHDCWIFIYSPDEPEFLLKRYEEDHREGFIKRHNERDELLGVIEDEFRALLGVDNTTSSTEQSGTQPDQGGETLRHR